MNEVRFLQIEHYSNHPEVVSAATVLVESYMATRQRRRNEEAYIRDAKKLIASLWMRGDSDLFRFTTKEEFYSAGKRKQVWMTPRVRTLFNEMRRIGWVNLVKEAIPPHASTKAEGGQAAIYCRTKKFKDLLTTLTHSDIAPDPDAPRVEMRSKEGLLVDLPESYQQSSEYLRTVEAIDSHFSLLSRSDIRFGDGKPVPASAYFFVRKYRPDLTSGGRFYAAIQNLPKSERLALTIASKPVGSLDISQLHPVLILRLLSHSDRERDGMLFPALSEAYEMPDYPELPRAVHKKLINALFNAPTEESAVRSLMNHHYWFDIIADEWVVTAYKGNEKRQGAKVFETKPKTSAQDYVEAFRLRHPSFSEAICSGIGSKLQKLDGDLIEIMISAATAHSIPVIPVHDEIILPAEHRRFGEILLERSFRAIFGDAGKYGSLRAKWSMLDQEEVVEIPLDIESS